MIVLLLNAVIEFRFLAWIRSLELYINILCFRFTLWFFCHNTLRQLFSITIAQHPTIQCSTIQHNTTQHNIYIRQCGNENTLFVLKFSPWDCVLCITKSCYRNFAVALHFIVFMVTSWFWNTVVLYFIFHFLVKNLPKPFCFLKNCIFELIFFSISIFEIFRWTCYSL